MTIPLSWSSGFVIDMIKKNNVMIRKEGLDVMRKEGQDVVKDIFSSAKLVATATAGRNKVTNNNQQVQLS